MGKFKAKTVIITGGSRGIGQACCLAFAKAGANVIFTYVKNDTAANKLRIQIGGDKCLAIKADVRDYAQCRKIVETAIEKFKKIDILINNAGITKDKALMMMTGDDWRDVTETNLGGTFNMTRALITIFLKQKEGCVINMSSVSAIVGVERQTNYSASKAGIIGFSKALAKEVAAYNIRVNVICPGYIDTDMTNALDEKKRERILEVIPAKRMGRAHEVADLCLFLASKHAGYITGSTLSIDGGLSA